MELLYDKVKDIVDLYDDAEDYEIEDAAVFRCSRYDSQN